MMDDIAVVTKEQIIAELQQLAQEQGRVPRRSMYNHFEKARQLFGSWPDALKAAGLENEPKRFYKEDYLIAEVKRISQELGRPPISGPHEFPLYMSVMEYYDSWEAFLERAGLTKFAGEEEGKEVKEKLIRDILEMERIMRRFPTMSEFEDYRLVRYYFGSWKNFKVACEEKKQGVS
ncbi:hypothetical protein BMT55_10145 [Listeria newyorkensis]|uniref:Uncharacterized protein n=1 Tax=Listeria newyorkensis TaxID=1497681 RepID=A0ABX4XMF5_9LIST|nr:MULTISPECIES: hypothetical protein [Listeria]KGL44792.1 hypothetical protein EP56_04360 [Listeriaceae bacterium FSL A5-0209]KGL41083.1 hypothetical protein EP58_12155 [Listeria newyorkensis]KMT59635.1 hypothetical protein X559_2498 [Listeria newyorkensis]PNP91151.1 hypothetical protein BMT55_10145 [Listeria newyorkensis]RQW68490.1 hypothetical protein DUK53_03745 [Listeria sp. SHR_NRA_18]